MMKVETCTKNLKEKQILRLLDAGTVMIFIDARYAGVVVPEQFKADYQLRLNFDYAYEVSDLKIDNKSISGSLSFNQQPFFCVVPYEAIYLLISHHLHLGILFTESVPLEMLDYFASTAQTEKKEKIKMIAGESKERKSTPKKRGHLKVVK